MRKWLGGLTALMVVGAAAVYMAASYAAWYPNSFVGQCTATVEFVARRCNPVAFLQQMVHRPRVAAPAQPQPLVQVAPAPDVLVPAPFAVEPPVFMVEAAEPIEPIEVPAPQAKQGGIGRAGRGNGQEPTPIPFADDEPALPCPPVMVVTEEPRIPLHMPTADEEVPQAFCQQMLAVETIQRIGIDFESTYHTGKTVPHTAWVAIGEKTQLMPWADDDALAAGGDEMAEDGAEETESSVEIISEKGFAEFVDLQANEDDAATESSPPGATEETAPAEEQDRTGPADEGPAALTPCREDPHFHHNYPGCPYLGPCPTSGRAATPPLGPIPTRKQTMTDDDTCPSIGVDTMECRPTDVDEMDTNYEVF